MNLPKLAIDNYQFAITAFAGLLLLGIVSFLSMPQREDPALNIPNVVVVAVYPGASPQDIESQVVDHLEEAINELDDLEEMQTTIRDGVAVTEVEFTFDADGDDKFDEVQRQINQVKGKLPADLYQLDVLKMSTNSVAIMQLALVSPSAPYRELKKEAEHLKAVIEQAPGVRKVEIQAYPEEEVQIGLDPVKMTLMNISLQDVERAIRSNNANIPGGSIEVADKQFNIKTSGAYADLEEIRNTVVGAAEGKIIYLKNIATVDFGYEDTRWLARLSGRKGIYLTVKQKEGYSIFSTTKPVKESLAAQTLPGDMELAYVFDQSEGVEERVNGFLSNLLQGIFLVGAIIFIVLGVRSASIVMTTIPLSILIGLWVVGTLDFSLQQMSIAGLVVALGLLVDNSIAIIENIERYLALGYSRREAAIRGAEQLKAPIISATLTTVLAFVPIVTMPDTTGQFIRALPITVIATLVASLVIALSLTPLLAKWILRERNGAAQPSTTTFQRLEIFVKGPYTTLLEWVFRHKYVTLALAVAALAGSLALFPLVGVSFFPKAEKPQFRITVTLPNGSNIEATDAVVREVEAVLSEYDEIAYYAANTGHGNPQIYYNVASENYSNSFGEILVVLKTYDIDRFYSLLEELRNQFSGHRKARIDVREFVQGPPSEAPVAIKVFGNDLDRLQDYARQIENIVRQTPGAINVDNPLRSNSTDLHVEINRDKAMMLGVPIHQVDQTIRSYVNGATIGTFRDEEAEEYDLVMRYGYREEFRHQDFDRISVQALSGRFIPLRQVAGIAFKESPSRITHLDQKRTATILADLDQDFSLDEVISAIDVQLQRLEWDEGYSYTFKGDLENRNKSFGGMGIASLLALLMIMGVLIIQFRSFGQPLIIFAALPLAIIGSILALFLTGISFSFTAFIGLTSLIGIAINNSIVLVDFANLEMVQGAGPRQAAIHAGQVRFIPIVLTTLTTILGLLPLTLNGGSLWAPMGWTIIGGLVTSTTFVLLIVPLLFYLFTPEETV